MYITIQGDTKHEAAEIERMRAAQVAAVSDEKSKVKRDEARQLFPTDVWCLLREQFLSCSVCARMQTQKRIVSKCKRSRCKYMDAEWSEKLTKARRKDDPKDLTLGYLLTEQYRAVLSNKKKKRKRNVQRGQKKK